VKGQVYVNLISNNVNDDELTQLKVKDSSLASTIKSRLTLGIPELKQLKSIITNGELPILVENQVNLTNKVKQLLQDVASMKQFAMDRLSFYKSVKDELVKRSATSLLHPGIDTVSGETRLTDEVVTSRVNYSISVLNLFNEFNDDVIFNLDEIFKHVKFDASSVSIQTTRTNDAAGGDRRVRRRIPSPINITDNDNVSESNRRPPAFVVQSPNSTRAPLNTRGVTPPPPRTPLSRSPRSPAISIPSPPPSPSTLRTPMIFPQTRQAVAMQSSSLISSVIEKHMDRLNSDESINNFVDAKYSGPTSNNILRDNSNIVQVTGNQVTSVMEPEKTFEVQVGGTGIRFVKDTIFVTNDVDRSVRNQTTDRGDRRLVLADDFMSRRDSVVTKLKISDTNLQSDLKLAHKSKPQGVEWDKFDYARIVLLIASVRGIRHKGTLLVKPSLELNSSFNLSGF